MVFLQKLGCYLVISIPGFDYQKLVSIAGVPVNDGPVLMVLSWEKVDNNGWSKDLQLVLKKLKVWKMKDLVQMNQ